MPKPRTSLARAGEALQKAACRPTTLNSVISHALLFGLALAGVGSLLLAVEYLVARHRKREEDRHA